MRNRIKRGIIKDRIAELSEKITVLGYDEDVASETDQICEILFKRIKISERITRLKRLLN